jgi:serine protease Do
MEGSRVNFTTSLSESGASKDRASRVLLSLLIGGMLMVSTVARAELPDFVSLVKEQMPTVVSISVTQTKVIDSMPGFGGLGGIGPNGEMNEMPDLFRRFFKDRGFGGVDPNGRQHQPREFETQAQGSGSILTADGYILTNHHVVDGASKIMVRLSDRRELKAEVVGSDERSDIALIKIDANNLPTITTGTSTTLEIGEWVLAIGSPFGFEMSATSGIVSAKARNISEGDNRFNYVPFIQTDVAINPGNSGGPLFNLNGEVVGVNSIIFSKSGGYMGLSFAIPIEVAMDVVKQIKNGGHVSRGWLGVMIQPVNSDLAESFGMDRPIGALVAKIMKESPADGSELKVGDVIIEFNDKFIESNSHLPPIVGSSPVGESIPVKVMRNGSEQIIHIVIGELPEEVVASSTITKSGEHPAEQSVEKIFGMTLKPVPTQLRKKLALDAGGVLVAEVERNSLASSFGVKQGDVISKLNRINISSVKQLLEVIDTLPRGRGVPLYIIRENGPIFLALRLPR